MTLQETTNRIAKYLRISSEELLMHAQLAPYALTRADGNSWPTGTGSISEKRILYGIVKLLNPVSALDLGTRWGSTATQIISAMSSEGKLTSVDISMRVGNTKHLTGKFIPPPFQVILNFEGALDYLSGLPEKSIDFIYEDTSHQEDMTYLIYKEALKALKPGGVIISHDACSPKFEGAVLEGIRRNGILPKVYLVEGDTCGLSVYRKPKRRSSSK